MSIANNFSRNIAIVRHCWSSVQEHCPTAIRHNSSLRTSCDTPLSPNVPKYPIFAKRRSIQLNSHCPVQAQSSRGGHHSLSFGMATRLYNRWEPSDCQKFRATKWPLFGLHNRTMIWHETQQNEVDEINTDLILNPKPWCTSENPSDSGFLLTNKFTEL